MTQEMNKEIEIPEGYEARIEGNKVIIERKDSEDERIRKELLEYFHSLQLGSDCDFSPSFTVDDILAWLERQKDEAQKQFNLGVQAGREEVLYEMEKEQKSLSISAASKWLAEHVRNYINSEYNEFHKCVEYDGSIDKKRLINDFEDAMQKEQKPAEWSEEDDALLKEIVSFFRDGTVKLQHDLDLYAGFLEKKFKSLRPQPHWKPTIEQLSAFSDVLEESKGNRLAVLKDLYNHIKEV